MKIKRIIATPKRYTAKQKAAYKKELEAMNEDAQFKSVIVAELRRRGWLLVAERLEAQKGKGVTLNLGRFPMEETTNRNINEAKKMREVIKLKAKGWNDDEARREVFGNDAFAKGRLRGGNKEASFFLKKLLEAEEEENAIPPER